eukprot:COSAG03_NODE_14010_length_480_cov_0.813648_1_plen_51_part_01
MNDNVNHGCLSTVALFLTHSSFVNYDGAGGFSYEEFCDAPLLCFRLLQPKG